MGRKAATDFLESLDAAPPAPEPEPPAPVAPAVAGRARAEAYLASIPDTDLRVPSQRTEALDPAKTDALRLELLNAVRDEKRSELRRKPGMAEADIDREVERAVREVDAVTRVTGPGAEDGADIIATLEANLEPASLSSTMTRVFGQRLIPVGPEAPTKADRDKAQRALEQSFRGGASTVRDDLSRAWEKGLTPTEEIKDPETAQRVSWMDKLEESAAFGAKAALTGGLWPLYESVTGSGPGFDVHPIDAAREAAKDPVVQRMSPVSTEGPTRAAKAAVGLYARSPGPDVMQAVIDGATKLGLDVEVEPGKFAEVADSLRPYEAFDAANDSYLTGDRSKVEALPWYELPAILRGEVPNVAVFRTRAQEGDPDLAALVSFLDRDDSFIAKQVERLPVGVIRKVQPDMAPTDAELDNVFKVRDGVKEWRAEDMARDAAALFNAGLMDSVGQDGRLYVAPSKLQKAMQVANLAWTGLMNVDVNPLSPLAPIGVPGIGEAAERFLPEGTFQNTLTDIRVPTKAGLDSMIRSGTYDGILAWAGLGGSDDYADLYAPGSTWLSRSLAETADPNYAGRWIADTYERAGGVPNSPTMRAMVTADLAAQFLLPAEELALVPMARGLAAANRGRRALAVARELGQDTRAARRTALASMLNINTGLTPAEGARLNELVPLVRAKTATPEQAAEAAALTRKGAPKDAVGALHGQLLTQAMEGIRNGTLRPEQIGPRTREQLGAMFRRAGVQDADGMVTRLMNDLADRRAAVLDTMTELAEVGGPATQRLRASPAYFETGRELETLVRAKNLTPQERDVMLRFLEASAFRAVQDGAVATPEEYFARQMWRRATPDEEAAEAARAATEEAGAEAPSPLGPDTLYQERAPRPPTLAQQIRDAQFVPTDDIVNILGADRPAYLDEVSKFILEQREKVRQGKLAPRDVAKAYLITVASQNARSQAAEGVERLLGHRLDDRFIVMDKGRRFVRPEEATAAWLAEPIGKQTLDALDRGEWFQEGWDDFMRVRDAFGSNGVRTHGLLDPAPEGQISLQNIRDAVDGINAANGEPARVMDVLGQMRGIGTGKAPFIGHLLGFGEMPTMDAREIAAWMTGKKQVPPDAPNAALAYAAAGGKPPVTRAFMQKMIDGFERVRAKSGLGADLPPETFGAIMHHWLWDRVAKEETTHEGVYHTMRYASRDSGVTRGSIDAVSRADVSPNLVVMHNLTADNLLYADRLGGLVAPSLGVGTVDAPYTSFGGITLIGPSSMADPTTGTRWFDADVYSPRWPSKSDVVDRKAADAWDRANLESYRERTGSKYLSSVAEAASVTRKSEGWGGGWSDLKNNPAMQLKYVEEVLGGKPAIPTTVDARYPGVSQSEPVRAVLADIPDEQFTALIDDPPEELRARLEQAVRAHAEAEGADAAAKSGDPKAGETVRKGILTDVGMRVREGGGSRFDPAKRMVDAPLPVDKARELIDGERAVRRGPKPDRSAAQRLLRDTIDRAPGGQEAYEKWYDGQLDTLRKSAVFVPEGKNRPIPYTADNILAELTRKVRAGENFNYGLGSARAKGAKQYRSIAQMQADRARVVSAEAMKAAKADLDAGFDGLMAELQPYYTGTAGLADEVAAVIGESYTKGARSALRTMFKGVPADVVKQVEEFASTLKNAPTEYLEGKPNRIIGIGEFKAAVVPENLPSEAMATLQKNGVTDIVTYDPNDPASRAAAIRDAATRNEVLFSREGGITRGAIQPIRTREAVEATPEFMAEVGASTTVEGGKTFETGVPVEVPFTRNTESARKFVRNGRWAGLDTGVNVEPAGRFMLHDTDPARAPLPKWEKGTVTFQSPLVIEHVNTTSAPDGWKARLSNAFGGKTGDALSRAIVESGYDGIVTTDKYGTSEIVDLTGLRARLAANDPSILRSQTTRGAITPEATTRTVPNPDRAAWEAGERAAAARVRQSEQADAARRAQLETTRNALRDNPQPSDREWRMELDAAEEALADFAPSSEYTAAVAELNRLRSMGAPARNMDAPGLTRWLIRLFKTGDVRTAMHEGTHLLDLVLGEEWTRRAAKALGYADDQVTAAFGDNRLLTEIRERIAEAGTRELRGTLRPGSKIANAMEDVSDFIGDVWRRVRNTPGITTPEFRRVWDATFRPQDTLRDLAVRLVDEREPGPITRTVFTTGTPEEEIRVGPQRRRGQAEQATNVLRADNEVRAMLGIREGQAEVRADELLANALATIGTEQARRSWGFGELEMLTPLTAVSPQRKKDIQREVAAYRAAWLGGEAPRPSVVGGEEVFTLTPDQARGMRAMVNDLLDSPVSATLPERLKDPAADVSTLTAEEWNAIVNRQLEMKAGAGAWRDRAAERAAVSGATRLVNLVGDYTRDPRRPRAVADTATALRDAFVVQAKVADYVNPAAREVLEGMAREIGDAGKAVAERVINYQRQGTGWREALPLVAPSLPPESVPVEQLSTLRAVDRIPEATDIEQVMASGDDLRTLFNSSPIADPRQTAYEQAGLALLGGIHARMRDGFDYTAALSDMGVTTDAANDAMAYVQEGVRRRRELVDQVGKDILLTFAGADDVQALAGQGPLLTERARRAYASWYTGDWVDGLLLNTETGKAASSPLFDQGGAALRVLVRLEARRRLAGMTRRLAEVGATGNLSEVLAAGTRYDRPYEFGTLTNEVGAITGPKHLADVAHYIDAETNWSLYDTVRMDAPEDVPSLALAPGRLPPSGAPNPLAHDEALRILQRLGFKRGKGTGWKSIDLPDGSRIIAPPLFMEPIEEVVKNTAPTAGAFGSGEKLGTMVAGTGNARSFADNAAQLAVDALHNGYTYAVGKFKAGLTTGLGPLMRPAFFMGNFLGGMAQAYTRVGAVGAAKALTKPLLLNEEGAVVRRVMKRMWADGQGFPGWAPERPMDHGFFDAFGRWHSDRSIADGLVRAGLNSSLPQAELSRSLIEDIKANEPGIWNRLMNNPKLAAGVGAAVGGVLGGPGGAVAGAPVGAMLTRWWQDTMTHATTGVDNYWRVSLYVDALKRGVPEEEAARVARDATFDYNQMADFERRVMRRAVLFYSFQRRNQDLFWWAVLNEPGRLMAQFRLLGGLQRANLEEDPELFLPEWAEGRPVVGWREPLAEGHAANNSTGAVMLLPRLPIGDALGLWQGLWGALNMEPSGLSATVGKANPLIQAGFILTTGTDVHRMRSIESYNVIPNWFVEMDDALTGGMLVRDTFRATPAQARNPASEGYGNAPVWVVGGSATDKTPFKWWWVFRQLTAAGSAMDTITQMQRADFGETLVGEHGYVQAAVDAATRGTEGLPEDTETARVGLTEGEELGKWLGVMPLLVPSRPEVAGRAEMDVRSDINERIRGLRKTEDRAYR